MSGAIAIAVASPGRGEEQAFAGAIHLEPLALPALSIHGVGVARVNEAAPAISLRTLSVSGGVAGASTVPLTDPEVTASGLVALRVQASLGTGVLALSGAVLASGSLPVGGLARLCLFLATCAGGPAIPLTSGNGEVGLGVGGQLTAGGSGLLRISVEAAPWTLAQASLPVTTPSGGTFAWVASGWVHGPLSFTGSTALPGGALSVVTPLRVRSLAPEPFDAFGRLEVRFVPEPGRLVLLTSGLLGLAWLGHRRRRR